MFDAAPGHCMTRNRLPLCGRYLVVCGRSVSWRTLTGESDDATPLLWAVGALTDGGTEILGAWPSGAAGRIAWSDAWSDLRCRGVEQIRVLVTEEAGALAADFPGRPAIVPCSACTPESLSSLGLAARHRRIVERATLLADSVNATIVRRLSRKAPFDSAADALEFVVRSLDQAQRRIETSPEAFSATRQRPGGGPAPRAVTARRQVVPVAAKGLGT